MSFLEDDDYRQQQFKAVWRVWFDHSDKDGLMHAHQLPAFLESFWGKNSGAEWSHKYWGAINAYDKSYEGIKIDDFVECWVHFDFCGLDFYKNRKFPKYKYDESRTAGKRAENFEELSNDVCNEIRNHWKNKPQHE